MWDAKPLKTVYIVRHGQSEHNITPVFDSDDVALSDTGESQAMTVAERLAKVQFEALVASPLKRAQQTAKYIADKSSKHIILSNLFIECRKPTELKGRSHQDKAAQTLWRNWQHTLQAPNMGRVGDGENYEDFTSRTREALDFLLSRPESTLTVVCHAQFLRALIAQVVGGDDLTPAMFQRFLRRISFENTGITVLRYIADFEQEPAWRIWTLNDHSHFAE